MVVLVPGMMQWYDLEDDVKVTHNWASFPSPIHAVGMQVQLYEKNKLTKFEHILQRALLDCVLTAHLWRVKAWSSK